MEQPLQIHIKYFQIHYLHGLNKWNCDHVAQRSHNITNFVLEFPNWFSNLWEWLLGKLKFYKIFTSAKVATCHFFIESAFLKSLLRKFLLFVSQEWQCLVSPPSKTNNCDILPRFTLTHGAIIIKLEVQKNMRLILLICNNHFTLFSKRQKRKKKKLISRLYNLGQTYHKPQYPLVSWD